MKKNNSRMIIKIKKNNKVIQKYKVDQKYKVNFFRTKNHILVKIYINN